MRMQMFSNKDGNGDYVNSSGPKVFPYIRKGHNHVEIKLTQMT